MIKKPYKFCNIESPNWDSGKIQIKYMKYHIKYENFFYIGLLKLRNDDSLYISPTLIESIRSNPIKIPLIIR